ncbi:MAG: peptidase [Candidatus Muproteobacteria bacterium RBG_16_62_13]|uniref:Peptidase n=1 Tax=Candidatus Muproteobacteria bacterium RBG_16_62_13 TaxID=1817756 RepID=A0A1F6SYT2_9PROT|nr:MAG: peptidase [Candidatus Muproteobacteria bacterium RBG_16_62_13]
MKPAAYNILVDVPLQTMTVTDAAGKTVASYRVATARNGVGEKLGSEQTPRGRHYIRAKVGAGLPAGAVLVSRRPTGEIFTPDLRLLHPNRDWILTRIMWLCGRERGKNRLGNVDTLRRYIYIHGCPDDDPMGIPSSRGCVKMHNRDIIELFDLVPAGTPVTIRG